MRLPLRNLGGINGCVASYEPGRVGGYVWYGWVDGGDEVGG